MKIIDKNTDFYDYLQNVYRDDNLTLDRTDSFLLTKDDFRCGLLHRSYYREVDEKNPVYRFVLLQIGYTYWLFCAEITKIDIGNKVKEYSIDLLSTWKNYNKSRCLIRLENIEFPLKILYGKNALKLSKEYLTKRTPVLAQAIDMGEYQTQHNYCRNTTFKSVGLHTLRTEKHIPLLKACGLSNLLDPLEVYLAFEEYLSSEKTSSERTTSVGLTDKEKIENHGFDLKTSFRG